jgi:hypothetical protein
MEWHSHGRVGILTWRGMLEDLMVALGPHRLPAGSLQRGHRLLSGDATWQPAGHAGICTSIEVTSGGTSAGTWGTPSSSR